MIVYSLLHRGLESQSFIGISIPRLLSDAGVRRNRERSLCSSLSDDGYCNFASSNNIRLLIFDLLGKILMTCGYDLPSFSSI